MRFEKQYLWLKFLNNGKFRVLPETGVIETYRKATKSWKPLKVSPLPSGYIQYNIRRDKEFLIIYGHVAVWMAANGSYPEGMVINHKDFNPANNRLDNLELCTQKENVVHSRNAGRFKAVNKEFSLIRNPEIKTIRLLLANNFTHMQIADQLALERCAVSYVCRQIQNGKRLKFEHFLD